MRGRLRGATIAVARRTLVIAKVDGERTSNDRLNTGTGELVGEFECAAQIIGIGERQRRLTIGLGELGKPPDRHCALEQRIRRMHMQMDEAGHSTLAIRSRACDCVSPQPTLSTANAGLAASSPVIPNSDASHRFKVRQGFAPRWQSCR